MAIIVKNIQITNAPTKADAEFTATATLWTLHNTNAAIVFGDATDDEATDAKESTVAAKQFAFNDTYESLNERFLIPAAVNEQSELVSYEYLVNFDVELYIGTSKIATYQHRDVSLNFAPKVGTAYDVTTELTPATIDPEASQDPIQFTVNEIKGWDNGSVDALPL